jgi:uncharacterized membrane protein (DUF373 family)
LRKSDDVKCDQIIKKKHQHVEQQINTIRYIMMFIFVWYIFDIIDIDVFLNKLGQTLHRLNFKNLICTTLCQGGTVP